MLTESGEGRGRRGGGGGGGGCRGWAPGCVSGNVQSTQSSTREQGDGRSEGSSANHKIQEQTPLCVSQMKGSGCGDGHDCHCRQTRCGLGRQPKAARDDFPPTLQPPLESTLPAQLDMKRHKPSDQKSHFLVSTGPHGLGNFSVLFVIVKILETINCLFIHRNR